MPRILAVIIAHPRRKVCGATNAGRDLSRASARLVDIELAIMWDEDSTDRDGPLTTYHLESTNVFGPFMRFVPNALCMPFYGSRIPELVRSRRYDLVHIHNIFPPRAAAAVARACREAGVPYVISTHGFDEQSRYAELRGYGGFLKWLTGKLVEEPFRRIVRDAAGLFALSDFDIRLLTGMDVPAERIHLVTNGVNEYYLSSPSPQELADIENAFHLRPEAPVLLYMGSLHGYKGVDIFLESLNHLAGEWHAVVAGRFRDPGEPGRLMDAVRMPEVVRQRIVFTGGVTDAQLRALYHRADLFVYPTRGDTLPLVVLEAMAGSTAVVSTNVGGIPFQVSDTSGILVPPGDAAAVRSAVHDLLGDPARRAAMGAVARERVEHTFRWHLAAEQAMIGYEKLLGRPATSLVSAPAPAPEPMDGPQPSRSQW